jgi:phosphatidate cytidylyltransferase
MLKTRIITAVALLAVLLPIIFSGSIPAFTLIASLFFCAAMWENQRLFNKAGAIIIAVIWTLMYAYSSLNDSFFSISTLFFVAVLFWLFGLIPSLRFGLPQITSFSSGLIGGVYSVAIFACFIALNTLFSISPVMLLSSMALVWIADIGAYFTGRKWGKRKLAVSISPGKSWEGAIGGWVAVVIASVIFSSFPVFLETFSAKLYASQGMLPMLAVVTLIAIASVIGDLFESLLKRRIGFKDSSQLLPGHGGVLDRIDALIPTMPIAALLAVLWKF